MPYPARTSSAHMSRTMVRSDGKGEIAGSCLLERFIVFIRHYVVLVDTIASGVSIDKGELKIMRLSRHSET